MVDLGGIGDGQVVRVREALHRHVDGDVGERPEQAAGEHDLLAADPVRQPPEEYEEWRADGERDGDEQIGRLPVELELGLQEGEGVELPRVPDDPLSGRGAEQRQRDVLRGSPG
jgi:hypothetical protein